MISFSCIAASVCFTVAVIAVREGRYEAALVFFVLFSASTMAAIFAEWENKRLNRANDMATRVMFDSVMLLKKVLDDKKGEDGSEMQSGEQEADTGTD